MDVLVSAKSQQLDWSRVELKEQSESLGHRKMADGIALEKNAFVDVLNDDKQPENVNVVILCLTVVARHWKYGVSLSQVSDDVMMKCTDEQRNSECLGDDAGPTQNQSRVSRSPQNFDFHSPKAHYAPTHVRLTTFNKISPIRDWRSTPTYCQLQSHVTQKLGKNQNSGRLILRYCPLI